MNKERIYTNQWWLDIQTWVDVIGQEHGRIYGTQIL